MRSALYGEERVLAQGPAGTAFQGTPRVLAVTERTVYFGGPGRMTSLAYVPRDGSAGPTRLGMLDTSILALGDNVIYGCANFAGPNDVLCIHRRGGPFRCAYRSKETVWFLAADGPDLFVVEPGVVGCVRWSRRVGGDHTTHLVVRRDELEVFVYRDIDTTRMLTLDRATGEVRSERDVPLLGHGLVATDDAFYGFRITGGEMKSDLFRVGRDGSTTLLVKDVDGGGPLRVHRGTVYVEELYGGALVMYDADGGRATLADRNSYSAFHVDDAGIVWLRGSDDGWKLITRRRAVPASD